MLKDDTTKKNMFAKHFSQPTGKERLERQLILTLSISFWFVLNPHSRNSQMHRI